MTDTNTVQGLFVVRLWDAQKFDNYHKHQSNGIILPDEMIAKGLFPESEQRTKNKVTEGGLAWLRGTIQRDPNYGSYMGEMALSTSGQELVIGANYARKKLTLSNGSTSGQIVENAWWDSTMANGISITGFSIYTIVDGTTPAQAKAVWYATANLATPVTKSVGTPQTLTITRYETFTSA